MRKKLTEEKQLEILEAGIAAFAEGGFHAASMAEIARRAGISVGVLYKYYANKEDFFRACLRHSLAALERVLGEVTAREEKLLTYAARLLKELRDFSREHPSHIRLYHQITNAGGAAARRLAEEVEGAAARLYTEVIAKAQAAGEVRRDMDPRLLAFFFDNLLMMLQFSCSCGYYRSRLALYWGGAAEEEQVAEELLKFLESAFTLERNQIDHRPKAGGRGNV